MDDFHVNVGMFARLGYSRIASPDRYSLRLVNLLSSSCGKFCTTCICMRSGRSLPAIVVAYFWA